ncbi:MAG: diaminopimelate epimerase, partial [Acidobacteriota bacterium]
SMFKIPFTKAQGAGNDFLIVEDAPETGLPSPEWRRRICDRRYGVGADGLLWLSVPSTQAGADADLRIFNSDGGEAEISGNGTRCAAAFLAETGRCKKQLAIHTGAGLKKLTLIRGEENHFVFEMAMGAPILAAALIPFHPHPPAPVAEPIVGFQLPLPSGPQAVTVTSMGNPHCSVSVEHFDWDWEALGAEIEGHSFFPRRTNAEFYRVHSRHEIEVRYWERGVGPTFSSGTGSCAAAAAAILGGQAESPVTVKTVAGDLQVRWEKDGIYLTGPAEIVCRGEFLCGREHSGMPAAAQTGR